ncbi:MAG: MarR family transcriptional regulator [Planctomycetes bacterium]|nr:MarR family transcriptional regulator [Planctomycetota bacterium]
MSQSSRSQLLSPFHRALRQIQIAIEEIIRELHISLSAEECHALAYISEYGPCPTGDIQKILGVQRSTITSMLQRLESKKCIVRERSAQDKRIILVTCTDNGKRLSEKAKKAVMKLEENLLSKMDGNDLLNMQRIFTIVNEVTGVTVVNRTENK